MTSMYIIISQKISRLIKIHVCTPFFSQYYRNVGGVLRVLLIIHQNNQQHFHILENNLFYLFILNEWETLFR